MLLRVWEQIKKQSILFTSSHKRSKFRRYIVPLVFVVIVIGAKVLLKTYVSENTAYHLLTLIIILSAWYGGFGPGLLATFLTAVVDTLLFLPPGETYMGLYNIISTITLVIGGVFVSFISEARRQADLKKDEFIGFASHELKNPLASIQGYAQILQKMSIDSSQRRARDIAKSVEEQSKRASMLINELLDVTKIESGKLTYNDETFILYDLVESIANDQKVIYKSHKIVINATSKKKVFADKHRIEQVIVNLITNAIKYSPDAKKIIITCKNKSQDVIVSVQDFGKGIARENVNKIFAPYFREHSVSDGKIQGLGLGLYISSEIVKRHKGKLWLESKEGDGSTFYMSLPTVSRNT